MARNNDFKVKLTMVGIVAIVFLVACATLSFWTQSNLDFWLTHFKGSVVHVPYWLSFLLTLFTNGVALVGNIIMSIARLAF